MTTLINLVKIALTSAQSRGINVYISPDNLTGHLYEFGIPDSDGNMFVIAIQKNGTGSFAHGKSIVFLNEHIDSGNYDSDQTNDLVVRVMGYLSQLST